VEDVRDFFLGFWGAFSKGFSKGFSALTCCFLARFVFSDCSDTGFALAGNASPGMGGRQPRLGASSVPRQVAAPHQHGYSAFSFLV
jgi:hypothetical protein